MDCEKTAQDFKELYEETITTIFTCTEDCTSYLNGDIYGTNVYRDDSHICKAAIHSGFFNFFSYLYYPKNNIFYEEGVVQTSKNMNSQFFWVYMSAGEMRYTSSFQNRVNSLSSKSWPKSFYLEAVPGPII